MNLMSWLGQRPSIVTLVGAVLAATGAIIAGVGTYLQMDIQRARTEEIAALSKQNAAKSDRIAVLSEENAALSRETAESTKVTLATVTGGDSFCYLRMIAGGDDSNSPLLTLFHEGNYPLHDVQIRIWAPEDYSHLPTSLVMEDFLAKSTILPLIQTVSPGKVMLLRRWPLPVSDKKEYRVSIMARHQEFIESIKLRRINGKWEDGLRLYRGADETGSPLKEQYSKGFPRDQHGHIRWE